MGTGQAIWQWPRALGGGLGRSALPHVMALALAGCGTPPPLSQVPAGALDQPVNTTLNPQQLMERYANTLDKK